MGWGRGGALLLLLWGLLGTAPALRCPRCDVTGCRPVSCPSPHAVCRRTTLRTLRDGRELWREEGGCDVTGPPDVVITFRSHGELVTLREERWGGEGRRPAPNGTGGSPAEGRPLLCPTCDSSDGSCGRPLAALPCPRPRDLCLELSTRGPRGGGEGRLRGCGSAGPCRGLLAFDSGSGRRVRLRCCQSGQCEPEDPPPSGLRCWGCDGRDPSGCDPQVVPCGAGLTHCGLAWTYGPSGEPWLVRGCATPAWCETPVGLGGLRGGPVGPGGAPVGPGGAPVGPRCCRGHLCNGLPGDPSPSAAPPPPAPLPLLLPLLPLLAAPQV